MNLVAQEYVVCQAEKKGVLILSEFAGVCNPVGQKTTPKYNIGSWLTKWVNISKSLEYCGVSRWY